MAYDKPEYFTDELAKNSRKSAWYELVGVLVGGALGSVVASARNLSGWQFLSKATDFAFVGWLVGLSGRLWSEKANNQTSALQMDSKLIGLQHENKWLKAKVTELGGQLPEAVENHAEKILSERAAPPDTCPCRFKH